MVGHHIFFAIFQNGFFIYTIKTFFMGYSIMKHWKVNQSGYPTIETPEVSCYLYDRFFRFIKIIPAMDISKYLVNEDGDTYNIYLTHRLIDGKTRNLQNISEIQCVSYYFRPSIANIELLDNLRDIPYIIVAGLTPSGGLRLVVSCTTNGEFINPVSKYNMCWDKVLVMLKGYGIQSPKSTSTDVLGCISMLQPDTFYYNSDYKVMWC
jgi:hypothetical protein